MVLQEYQQEMSLCSPVGRIVDCREARQLTFSFSVLDRRVKEAPWRAPRLRGNALNLIGSELISRLSEMVRKYRLKGIMITIKLVLGTFTFTVTSHSYYYSGEISYGKIYISYPLITRPHTLKRYSSSSWSLADTEI